MAAGYNDPNYDMMLSTSIKKLNDTNNGYGDYTVVLSTSKMNRSGGNYNRKIGDGGTNKGFEDFINNKDFRIEDITWSKDIPYKVKKYLMSLEYPTLIKDMEFDGKKYSKEELTNIWKNVTSEIASSQVNEVGALNPKVQQIIIHKVSDNAQIPDEIIKIANKYKIPIFITKN